MSAIATLGSCIGFMALVAWISYVKTRGQTGTRAGYFLAGRGLTGVFIAGSLLLTNLSAEQLIGLNGSAYAFNLSSMAWEVTAVFAMVIMATVLLPRYLRGGFTTLPEFLARRFDERVRRLSVVLFILGYGLVTIPSVLYSGSVAVLQLFDVPALLGVDDAAALLIVIFLIGTVGGLYAVAGGLRAVAVSDTLNGVGLLAIGVLVPVLGLVKLGDGSFAAGLARLTGEHTHKLDAIGAATDPTPFATLFTGMILANLFYWGTNQYVIQRTLGAPQPGRRPERRAALRVLQDTDTVFHDGPWRHRLPPLRRGTRLHGPRLSAPGGGCAARRPRRLLSRGAAGGGVQFVQFPVEQRRNPGLRRCRGSLPQRGNERCAHDPDGAHGQCRHRPDVVCHRAAPPVRPRRPVADRAQVHRVLQRADRRGRIRRLLHAARDPPRP